MSTQPTRVLFVCMGNICRSPAAEIVFRKLVADEGLDERIEIDSAGTIVSHPKVGDYGLLGKRMVVTAFKP